MAIITLLDGVGAVGAGTAVDLATKSTRFTPEGIVKTIISNTATAAIEGSLDKSTWLALDSNTASAWTDLPFVPRFIRGNVTAFTSGTVTMTIETR